MELLLIYLAVAIGASFLCSLCEAVLLTLTPSDAEVMIKEGNPAGRHLKKLKESIDRPLAAILTLNTVAHTVGAAGVGAQATFVFGDEWLGVVSGVLTFLILVVSEIIPKSLGASRARLLAGPMTYVIIAMIWGTYPAVVMLDFISSALKGSHKHDGLSRDQFRVLAEMAKTAGTLESSENEILENLFNLRETHVEEIMTPRTVAFYLRGDERCSDVLAEHGRIRFSRIPVFGDGPEELLGVVLKSEIQDAVINGRGQRQLRSMTRSLHYVPETAPLTRVLEEFSRLGHHLFGVVDEHGTLVGLVSLEDVFESIIGAEIVDETDLVADMRDLASPDAEQNQADEEANSAPQADESKGGSS